MKEILKEEQVRTLLVKTSDQIYDDIDLGTPFQINIFIYNGTAYIVNGLDRTDCDLKDLGREIAENILLNGLITSNNYGGSFVSNPSLKSVDDVLDFKDDDFDFDMTLFKFWEVVRVVANTAKQDIIYNINYSAEANDVYFDKALANDLSDVQRLLALF